MIVSSYFFQNLIEFLDLRVLKCVFTQRQNPLNGCEFSSFRAFESSKVKVKHLFMKFAILSLSIDNLGDWFRIFLNLGFTIQPLLKSHLSFHQCLAILGQFKIC